jgi:hypothetical protein
LGKEYDKGLGKEYDDTGLGKEYDDKGWGKEYYEALE